MHEIQRPFLALALASALACTCAHGGDCVADAKAALAEIHKGSPRVVESYSMAADGSLLIASVNDSIWSALAAFDLKTGARLWMVPLDSPAASVALSSSGQLLAVTYKTTLCNRPHVELRSAKTGAPSEPLDSRSPNGNSDLARDSADSAVFSADGSLLVASSRNAVRGWDTRTGRNRFSLQPPGFASRAGVAAIGDIALSNDGSLLAGASKGAAFLWYLRDGKPLSTFPVRGEEVSTVVISPDGKLLAAGTNGPTSIWRIAGKRLIASIQGEGPIGPLTFGRDGRTLITSGPAGIQTWDISTAPPKGSAPIPIKADVFFPIADERIAGVSTGSAWQADPFAEERVRVVDVKTGNEIGTLRLPGRPRTK